MNLPYYTGLYYIDMGVYQIENILNENNGCALITKNNCIMYHDSNNCIMHGTLVYHDSNYCIIMHGTQLFHDCNELCSPIAWLGGQFKRIVSN